MFSMHECNIWVMLCEINSNWQRFHASILNCQGTKEAMYMIISVLPVDFYKHTFYAKGFQGLKNRETVCFMYQNIVHNDQNPYQTSRLFLSISFILPKQVLNSLLPRIHEISIIMSDAEKGCLKGQICNVFWIFHQEEFICIKLGLKTACLQQFWLLHSTM